MTRPGTSLPRQHRQPTPPRRRWVTIGLSTLLGALVLGVGGVVAGVVPAPDEVEASSATTDDTDGTADAREASTSASGPSRTQARARSQEEAVAPAYSLADPPAPLERKPKPKPKAPPEPEVPEPFSLRVATFNVLGSQHTRGGGGFGPGTHRAGLTADIVNARGVDLVGFQEVQDDQLGVLQGRLGGMTVWPGQALGGNGVRLQIAWRDDRFEMVDSGSITTVFDSQMRPIPWVLLRDTATGGEFYAMTIHNSPRDMQGERDAARGAEIAFINELKATGRPVLVTGDMNEKERWFCDVGAGAGLAAANGGSTSGGCQLPPPPLRIDWIMGGGGDGVSFTDYAQENGGIISAASDHYFISATATVTPGLLPDADD